ncbi:MAG: DUF58 domain-containing protein [Chloroflexi bacterium]|nr:DUF58 domain-containing protein [Chloroflexota bacterium]
MLTADTLRQIRRIELQTRRLVDDVFAGAYHAVFKGRGIEFDAVRPYEPGDDVRDIDWNVTARAGEAFVKRYVEERELTVMLMLDTSASCQFGTVKRQKRDVAVELGAVLAYAAISNNDRVGLLLFSDRVEHYVPPRKGRNHTLRLIRDLLSAEPQGRGTDLALALQTINRLLKRRAIVFLMSDFLEPVETYAADLASAARRHDIIAVVLSDPREAAWPDVGLVALRDAETGGLIVANTSQATWRAAFQQQAQTVDTTRRKALANARVDRIDAPTDSDTVQALIRFFQQRARRLGR